LEEIGGLAYQIVVVDFLSVCILGLSLIVFDSVTDEWPVISFAECLNLHGDHAVKSLSGCRVEVLALSSCQT
jgi:hypothetical protein